MGTTLKFNPRIPKTKVFDVWIARYEGWEHAIVFAFTQPKNNLDYPFPKGTLTVGNWEFKQWFGATDADIQAIPRLKDWSIGNDDDPTELHPSELVWIKGKVELPIGDDPTYQEPIGLNLNMGGYA